MRPFTIATILVLAWPVVLCAQGAGRSTREALRAAPAQQLAIAYRDVSWHIEVLGLADMGGAVVLGGRTVNQDNVEAVKADLEQRRADLAAAIAERGSATIAGRYRAEADCGGVPSMWVEGIREGGVDVTIVQDSFAVLLSQESIEIAGVVVDSALAFHDPANSEFGFVGAISPEAIVVRPEVESILAAWPRGMPGGRSPNRHDLSRCVVRLIPQR